ncbi:MAG: hypothetical protein WDM86_18030 [Rhizomicrobium sp.]
MSKVTAILFAIGLSISGLSGAAQAAGGHGGGGGGGHFSGGGGGHFGGGHGGGHFGGHGGHGGGHYGGHYGHGYGGYGGFGYGVGLGFGLGALYYSSPYWDDYGYYGPPPYYYDDFPDDSAPTPDVAPGNVAPAQVPGYWYHCDAPAGFYPYVATCTHPWQAVPATPPPPSGGND